MCFGVRQREREREGVNERDSGRVGAPASIMVYMRVCFECALFRMEYNKRLRSLFVA